MKQKVRYVLFFLGGLFLFVLLYQQQAAGSFLDRVLYGVPADEAKVDLSPQQQEREVVGRLGNRIGQSRSAEPQAGQGQGQAPRQGYPDLVYAAERATESVVFIRTMAEAEYVAGNWMNWFFDQPFFEPGKKERVASGSGVIFSEDGYVVTNYHVIEGADRIEVVYKRKKFDAELMGVDPSTDLAVVKVTDDAPFAVITLGDSDAVRLGEWVLAIGNPFNLTSTVTAGIVSAKGRSIHVLKDRFPIESFIQTDAAINPGNSGGALVNGMGELIGINTAIFSKTGYYSGYGFAVPANLVSKVVKDIIRYGEVQRAYMGISLQDMDSDTAEKMGMDTITGVIVAGVQMESAAERAGLLAGDIILKVDGVVVDNIAALEERIGHAYPGDTLQLSIVRDGTTIERTITLLNREGSTAVMRSNIYYSQSLGATLEVLSRIERNLLGVSYGVRIKKVKQGFIARLRIPQNFVITHVNREPVRDVATLEKLLLGGTGKTVVEGVDERGYRLYYTYHL